MSGTIIGVEEVSVSSLVGCERDLIDVYVAEVVPREMGKLMKVFNKELQLPKEVRGLQAKCIDITYIINYHWMLQMALFSAKLRRPNRTASTSSQRTSTFNKRLKTLLRNISPSLFFL